MLRQKSPKKQRVKSRKKFPKFLKNLLLFFIVSGFFLVGAFLIWATTLDLPDLNNFDERRVVQSTRIYDRTGEIVLFDVFGDHKRTVIPLSEMSDYIKKATIAVEDRNFFSHRGIEISSIFRAVFNNIRSGNLLGGQGGSTITQQVIKNALLTREKRVSRKLKEWILAPRLERVLTKDQILEIYLNEIPYGGTVYGIQEAARRFFGKDAADLTLLESAYLAAIPQAPTFFSPHGNNLQALENRKNHVLDQMYNAGFITLEQRNEAQSQTVEFQRPQDFGIRAPHFVLYVLEQLENEFGRDVLEKGGLRVITTLDWELQQVAEEIVLRRALENSQRFDAENASLIATDPKTGEILVMVGSRDYFDEQIDGNFNIATSKRQPGSTFKSFVYAEAFNQGFTPDTVVFDLQTEFSTTCRRGGDCYSPVNFDGRFRGPISFRDALAQSINIPAVKAIHLTSIRDSLRLARRMGLSTLGDERQYGLSLALGAGEVRPIDLNQAYGVFAADGIKNELKSIKEIRDHVGDVLYRSRINSTRVLSEQTARQINDILSDNIARTPAFGPNSPLFFNGFDVAAKTGTTNDYRDAWTIGYTPNIVVTAWAGNNDNRSMDNRVAGFIISPLWNEFMQIVLQRMNHGNFIQPDRIDPFTRPILAGFWKGEEVEVFDVSTGLVADEDSNPEDLKMVVVGGTPRIHNILHWVDRNNPTGPAPVNPANDPQYYEWERSVRNWVSTQNINYVIEPTNIEDIIVTRFEIVSPRNNTDFRADDIVEIITRLTNKEILSGEVFINGEIIGELGTLNKRMMFLPEEIIQIMPGENNLEVRVTSEDGEIFSDQIKIHIRF